MREQRKYTQTENFTLFEAVQGRKMRLRARDIQQLFQKSGDVVIRPVCVGALQAALFCVDGLVDSATVGEQVLRPLAADARFRELSSETQAVDLLLTGAVQFPFVTKETNVHQVITAVLSGLTALVFDRIETAVLIDARGFEKRAVGEPTDENVIKGAKDCFVEVLRVNTATVRRKIKSPNLVIEESVVGKMSLTDLALVYLEGTVNRHILKEVRGRLKKMNIDGLMTGGYLEESLAERPFSSFPQLLYTERLDKFCSHIMEGRIGILADGLPTAYILPVDLSMFMRAPEDYADNYVFASVIRVLRYFCLAVSLLLPGFYIAITTFHPEMIPTRLVFSVQKAKTDVPFPTFVEIFGMLTAFEILLEAGLKLPKTIGQAVSVVGALVVGQAAAEAKIISPAVVIVIAFTGVCGFTVPNQDFGHAVRLWRFLFTIAGSLAGLFGVMMLFLFLLLELCSMQNFGTAYLQPLTDAGATHIRDTLLRPPMRYLNLRPFSVRTRNLRRQK